MNRAFRFQQVRASPTYLRDPHILPGKLSTHLSPSHRILRVCSVDFDLWASNDLPGGRKASHRSTSVGSGIKPGGGGPSSSTCPAIPLPPPPLPPPRNAWRWPQRAVCCVCARCSLAWLQHNQDAPHEARCGPWLAGRSERDAESAVFHLLLENAPERGCERL